MSLSNRFGRAAVQREGISPTRRRLLGGALGMALFLPAFAQTGAAPAPGARGSPATTRAVAPVAATDPTWQSLSPRQKEALQPLAPIWGDIEASRKRKWIALSADFASLSPADKRTMHDRMGEWASLTAAQRNRARLNFAQTRQLSNSEKKAQWDAYQALSPERKQELAAQAGTNARVRGAAPALPRSSNRKLAAVPTTRSQPEAAKSVGSDKSAAVPSEAASDAGTKP